MMKMVKRAMQKECKSGLYKVQSMFLLIDVVDLMMMMIWKMVMMMMTMAMRKECKRGLCHHSASLLLR